ncbi:hypothetical protein OZX73_08575 [Bifidobacterium sp. ESL0775]|uniref:hypothetical protein n=1 Tax=Bifidobacterium sp. ESL0775 TaxID=2983230 RepID=UPI0023F6ED00|nr:hypothetical protein [Bifidobacterium sp. ESL0775]WEV69295.1 hypothetical protein OZX73_08575 [Bifidobacterium sp. ESL0775]
MATTLKIETVVELGITDTLDPGKMEPAKVYGSDETKLVDGKPVFPVRGVFAADEKGYAVNVYVKLRNKPTAPIIATPFAPKRIELVNPVATVFVANNHRIAYSVVADSVHAVDDGEKAAK